MTTDSPAEPTYSSGELVEAIEVLRTSVAKLTHLGRFPTASEIRLDLRDRTYGGFKPSKLGFKRFRDFLAFAESRGVVSVDYDHPGDVRVKLQGDDRGRTDAPPPVRADLWRCFVDWNSSLTRYYDVGDDKAFIFPKEPAPLEPEKYRSRRQQLNDTTHETIVIEPIGLRTQLEWMQEFANSTDEPVLRDLLRSALSAEKPLKTFTTVLREFPPQQTLWKRLFSRKVRQVIESWAHEKLPGRSISIERRDVNADARSSAGSTDPEETLRSSAALPPTGTTINTAGIADLVSRLTSTQDWSRRGGSSPEVRLRAMLHGAIERMPAAELKKIVIPVGYLVED